MLENFFASPVLLAFTITSVAALATMFGFLAVVRSSPTHPRLLSFGLSFAGGAMVYISLVEILAKSRSEFESVLPSQEAYVFATLCFFIGILLLVLLERFVPHPMPHLESECQNPQGCCCTKEERCHMKSISLLTVGAITLHNFPEGMATFFATLEDPMIGAPLAFAILIHNIPEGVSIAVPVYCATGSRHKAFWACAISAAAEPVGAFLAYVLLAPYLNSYVFGVVFGIISGAMVFLSLHELLPAAKRYSTGHETVYGMVTGMALMALSLILFQ